MERNYNSEPSNPRSGLDKSIQTAFAAFVLSGSILLGGATTGCSTKNYVPLADDPDRAGTSMNSIPRRRPTTMRSPVRTSELRPASTTRRPRRTRPTSTRWRQGQPRIGPVNPRRRRRTGVDSLSGVIANLDQYKSLGRYQLLPSASINPRLRRTTSSSWMRLRRTWGILAGIFCRLRAGTDSIGNRRLQLPAKPAPRGCRGELSFGQVWDRSASLLFGGYREGPADRKRPKQPRDEPRIVGWISNCFRT